MLQLDVEVFSLGRIVVDSDDDWPLFEHGPNAIAPIDGANCGNAGRISQTAGSLDLLQAF
jgi:hypothetical protein